MHVARKEMNSRLFGNIASWSQNFWWTLCTCDQNRPKLIPISWPYFLCVSAPDLLCSSGLSSVLGSISHELLGCQSSLLRRLFLSYCCVHMDCFSWLHERPCRKNKWMIPVEGGNHATADLGRRVRNGPENSIFLLEIYSRVWDVHAFADRRQRTLDAAARLWRKREIKENG